MGSGVEGMSGFGLNARAVQIADRMIERAAELRVDVQTMPSGARIIDAGVVAPGGFGAGEAMAHACMGGLGHLSFVPLSIGGDPYQGVQVWTDHPAVACMASQYAGWAVHVDKYFAMGSGPLRAVARVEHELFEHLGVAENADRGVLVLEGRAAPDDAVATWVSERAGLPPSALTFI